MDMHVTRAAYLLFVFWKEGFVSFFTLNSRIYIRSIFLAPYLGPPRARVILMTFVLVMISYSYSCVYKGHQLLRALGGKPGYEASRVYIESISVKSRYVLDILQVNHTTCSVFYLVKKLRCKVL